MHMYDAVAGTSTRQNQSSRSFVRPYAGPPTPRTDAPYQRRTKGLATTGLGLKRHPHVQNRLYYPSPLLWCLMEISCDALDISPIKESDLSGNGNTCYFYISSKSPVLAW